VQAKATLLRVLRAPRLPPAGAELAHHRRQVLGGRQGWDCLLPLTRVSVSNLGLDMQEEETVFKPFLKLVKPYSHP